MKITYRALITFVVLILLNQNFLLAQNREIVRIVTYNILTYPNAYTQRNASFITVLDEVEPDILVVQEITSQFGVDEFRSSVLGNEYIAGPFINGDDTDNAIFYKDSLVTLIDNRNIPTALRDISEYTLVHNFSGDTLIIYSVHLKASQGVDNEQKRLAEVNILRNVTDNLPLGTNFMVIGDFNIYYSNEPAYQKLINQSTTGYFLDTQPAGNWHNNIAYASLHTQSTCGLLSGCPNGGSGGGMDDRFDMMLFSQAVSDTGGITYVNDSYIPFGNDGQHFNNSINDPPFNIISQQVADALYNASDHLPVYADFDFGIISNPSSITVTSPNGGENWIVGSSYNITWSSTDVTNVKIEYTPDNGTNWTNIIASTPSDGSHSWTVPNTPSTSCKVRVSDATNSSINDISDNVFTISSQESSISVTSPNGGENWLVDTIQEITWESSNVTNVKIEYSTDIGVSWINIIASTPSDGSYSWTIPNTQSLFCIIKIYDVNDSLIIDISDLPFTISNPDSITVTSPNGAEIWHQGTTEIITWDDNISEDVKIELYKDGLFHSTIISSIVSTGIHIWPIPVNLISAADYKVKITSIIDSSISDESDDNFTIVTSIPLDGLVAYYPFNGDASDESGNGLNGNVYGAIPETDRFGNSNSSYRFDGLDDYIEIGDNSLLNLIENWTYAAWVKFDQDIGNTYYTITMRGEDTADMHQEYIRFNGGTNKFLHTYESSSTSGIVSETNDSYPDRSIWYFATGTRDNLGNYKLYINGELAAAVIHFTPTASVSASTFIGIANNYAGGNFELIFPFKGIIDDVRIYDRALSEVEILALYNEGKGLAAVIQLSDSTLSFNNVQINSTSQKNFTVYNDASATINLEVTNITTGNNVYTITPTSFSIAPGNSQEVTVTFLPTEGINYNETLTIDHNSSGNQSFISLAGSGFNYPTTLALNKTVTFGPTNNIVNYRIIGLSGEVEIAVIEGLAGEHPYDWNVYWDNGGENDYQVQYNSTSIFDFTPGKSFWILSEQPFTISDQVNSVQIDSIYTYSIPLHNGWNLISNPFERSVSWAEVQSINSLLQNQVLYAWNGSWSNPTTMAPYEGYYFNNSGNLTTLKIPYDPNGSLGKFLAKNQSIVNAEEYLMLSLSYENNIKSDIFIGIDGNSSIGFDEYDYLAAPGDFENVKISLVNENLSKRDKHLFIEQRPEIGEGQVFDVEIKAIPNKKITLIAEGIENFNDYEIYLLEERLAQLYNLKEKSVIDLSPLHKYNNYKLLIGTSEFINEIKEGLVPTEYVLYQNYPNPFNPRTIIRFSLPKQSTVTLKVYSILGELVETLINNREYEIGNYEVEFDAGRFASGVYIYRITAGGFVDTKKLMLIK